MKNSSGMKTVIRKDYAPYPWALEQVSLRFEIGIASTRVHSRLEFSAREDSVSEGDIVLDGQDMELISLAVDGRRPDKGQYTLCEDQLIIHGAPRHCVVEIEVLIRPDQNTALEGVYRSGDFLLTQCEAEGFRKITYFPDRPDVMSRFDVTLVADRTRFPVLLSNGNPVESGSDDNGLHWVRWDDPFAKPSYLFALVAGDLACVEDRFTTRSGRDVALRFYVEHANADRCGHAMESLIRAMTWDEERFGLEYDLDIYNIVVTDDFNMGAMENKSLNIFNSKYVLARPDTATDVDYQNIEGVIGHEYFHNWTGNRVTCRDWFQLTLKEGLTVFRDQEFSSDMHSRAVKRIRDVRALRSRQFPEDAGPMSHPIRPDKYKEISNFYTMTVYQKGAEVIRMIHTLLGENGFRKGMDLYFERHDGQAVTCDDFLASMADANGLALQDFGRWYGQSGTPVITASGEYDPGASTFTLTLSQQTPATHDQADKQNLVIPVAAGLLGGGGKALPMQLAGEDAPCGTSRLLVLEQATQAFEFQNVREKPVPALLRGFSAPVRLEYPYSSEDLTLLMKHDEDPFMRWEAAQLLAQRQILDNVAQRARGGDMTLYSQTEQAFRALLADREMDPALLAEALILPGELYLSELMDEVDVDGIHAARQYVKSELARALREEFTERYQALSASAYSKASADMARRSLRNVCLSYLLETPGGEATAQGQLESSDNMTDSLAALQGLVWVGAAAGEAALDAFERKWQGDALVMDKWFSIQAAIPGAPTVRRVQALLGHPEFSMTNPNKVRSLIGVFAMANPTGFHAADGSGYRLHADRVIELNGFNPQIAARMAAAFNAWTRYDGQRRERMKAELTRIAASDSLSPDVSEIVGNALRMENVGSSK